MKDTFELTLNNPLTEEQWDMITDVDFDRTDRITFHTKYGKEVEFTKVIRCEHCEYSKLIDSEWVECQHDKRVMKPSGFCSWAEPKEEK